MKYYVGPADLHYESGLTVGLTRVELTEKISRAGLTSWEGLAETGIVANPGEAVIEFPSGERASVLITNVNTWNDYSMITVLGNGQPPAWGNLG